MTDRKLTKASIDAGVESLRYLRQHPTGTRFLDIRDHCEAAGLQHHSEPTVRRGLDWLRDYHDCPLEPDSHNNTWTLHDPEFTLPLIDPTAADLTAAIFARALIGPMVSGYVGERLQRLVEEMDARIHDQDGDAMRPPATAVAATVTTGTPVPPRMLSTLIQGIAEKQVLRLQYYSPWQDAERAYDVEPWQVRVHDSTMYLRGWSRGRSEARNFRVVQIRSVTVLEGDVCRGIRPKPDKIWGDGPGLGVDDDRPDTAVIRIRGAFARWVAMDRWHPEQTDAWIEPGEVLERTVPYSSCRELARRLLTLGDALISVGPSALRDEVGAHAKAVAGRFA